MKDNKYPYAPPSYFVDWLDEEQGRAAYFFKVDPGLFAPLISKFKKGLFPITFEYAVRLERAQKPSDNPLRAELLMTFDEHRELYRYVIGVDPAPAPVKIQPAPRWRKDMKLASLPSIK